MLMLFSMETYLDLLYSNSIWRQSSIPTSILMEELSSGYEDSVCTTISISLLISFSLLLIVARRKYLNRTKKFKCILFLQNRHYTLYIQIHTVFVHVIFPQMFCLQFNSKHQFHQRVSDRLVTLEKKQLIDLP